MGFRALTPPSEQEAAPEWGNSFSNRDLTQVCWDTTNLETQYRGRSCERELLSTYLHLLLCHLTCSPEPHNQGCGHCPRPHTPLLTPSTLQGLHTHTGPPADVDGTNPWEAKFVIKEKTGKYRWNKTNTSQKNQNTISNFLLKFF
jgi:hypothetical protein